mmetsp:Transcript_98252/g.273288  ORF Transcript_98252/g.273288 Transcript_98252/m.273288 type:complete len:235 (-) Transcript_98252:298-1002(-)
MARREVGGEGAQAVPRLGHRGAVWGQILRARCARHPLAQAWSLLPRGYWRFLQCRPPNSGKNHRPRRLHRGAGEEPGAFPASRRAGRPGGCGQVNSRRGSQGEPEPAHEGHPQSPHEVPHQDASFPHGHHHRRARHRACQARGAAGEGGVPAFVHGSPCRVLCWTRQDTGRLRQRQLRAHHCGPHGHLRAPLPEARLLHDHAGEGEPRQGRHRVLQEVWRILPWQHRRCCGESC